MPQPAAAWDRCWAHLPAAWPTSAPPAWTQRDGGCTRSPRLGDTQHPWNLWILYDPKNQWVKSYCSKLGDAWGGTFFDVFVGGDCYYSKVLMCWKSPKSWDNLPSFGREVHQSTTGIEDQIPVIMVQQNDLTWSWIFQGKLV